MNERRQSPEPSLCAGILTGGKGRRMGGSDKGLIDFEGRPLVEYLIERLSPQSDQVLINANRNLDRYARYGFPVVPDRLGEYQGPLAGFAALLEACPAPWLVVAPCDSPLIPDDYVARLHAARRRHPSALVVAHDGERIQPVHALIRQDLLPDLLDFLEQGERKIDRWYDRVGYSTADFSDRPQTFLNLNRPEDLAALQEARK